MARAALSEQVGKVVGYPPLCDMGVNQRREFHEAARGRQGKWQAAILAAEPNRPKLRVVSGD
jgi:hypothetical protein